MNKATTSTTDIYVTHGTMIMIVWVCLMKLHLIFDLLKTMYAVTTKLARKRDGYRRNILHAQQCLLQIDIT
mgnify:FL=1